MVGHEEDTLVIAATFFNVVATITWMTIRKHLTRTAFYVPAVIGVLVSTRSLMTLFNMYTEAKGMSLAIAAATCLSVVYIRKTLLKRAALYEELRQKSVALHAAERLVTFREQISYYEAQAKRNNLPLFHK